MQNISVAFKQRHKTKEEMTNMADQSNQGGFPKDQSGGQDAYSTTGDGHPPRPGEKGGQDPNSTTGDGHPPRPGEKGTQGGTAGQGLGQGGSK